MLQSQICAKFKSHRNKLDIAKLHDCWLHSSIAVGNWYSDLDLFNLERQKEDSYFIIFQEMTSETNYSGISIKRTHYKRTVWWGTDCFALRSNYLRKNLCKADSSLKRTRFLHQWRLVYRDSTVLTSKCIFQDRIRRVASMTSFSTFSS